MERSAHTLVTVLDAVNAFHLAQRGVDRHRIHLDILSKSSRISDGV
jgi:hypothetical protein